MKEQLAKIELTEVYRNYFDGDTSEWVNRSRLEKKFISAYGFLEGSYITLFVVGIPEPCFDPSGDGHSTMDSWRCFEGASIDSDEAVDDIIDWIAGKIYEYGRKRDWYSGFIVYAAPVVLSLSHFGFAGTATLTMESDYTRRGPDCPDCHGEGVIPFHDPRGINDNIPCFRCQGSGELQTVLN